MQTSHALSLQAVPKQALAQVPAHLPCSPFSLACIKSLSFVCPPLYSLTLFLSTCLCPAHSAFPLFLFSAIPSFLVSFVPLCFFLSSCIFRSRSCSVCPALSITLFFYLSLLSGCDFRFVSLSTPLALTLPRLGFLCPLLHLSSVLLSPLLSFSHSLSYVLILTLALNCSLSLFRFARSLALACLYIRNRILN